uniref:Uncharacterized protein n=1 Tax=Proboscia inermis TaxID=420281 RepID=A0A7S0CJ77_9STRA
MGHHGFFRDGDPLPEMRHGDQFAVFGPTTATFVLVPPGEHRLTQQQACGIPAGWKLREDAGDVGFAHVYQTRQPRLDVLLIRTIASVIPQLDSVQPVGNDRSDAQSPYSARGRIFRGYTCIRESRYCGSGGGDVGGGRHFQGVEGEFEGIFFFQDQG